MNPISILIADDDPLHREGIQRLLDRDPQFKVVGTAVNGEEALQMTAALAPAVLLLDIRMSPGIDGVEVIRRLRKQGSEVRIIALTNDELSILAVEREGANGYVPKSKRHMLIPAILDVLDTSDGQVYIKPRNRELSDFSERVELARLTPGERDILKLIIYTNREIARRLNKSERRVRDMLSEIYEKLDITSGVAISKRRQAEAISRLLHLLEIPPGFLQKSYES